MSEFDDMWESFALNCFRARVKMEFCRHRYIPNEKEESPPQTGDPSKQKISVLLHAHNLHLQETS